MIDFILIIISVIITIVMLRRLAKKTDEEYEAAMRHDIGDEAADKILGKSSDD